MCNKSEQVAAWLKSCPDQDTKMEPECPQTVSSQLPEYARGLLSTSDRVKRLTGRQTTSEWNRGSGYLKTVSRTPLGPGIQSPMKDRVNKMSLPQVTDEETQTGYENKLTIDTNA